LGSRHGYGCVADDAAQRARAVAAVMTVEGSSDAEQRHDGSSVASVDLVK
jgi:hypothetical protein